MELQSPTLSEEATVSDDERRRSLGFAKKLRQWSRRRRHQLQSDHRRQIEVYRATQRLQWEKDGELYRKELDERRLSLERRVEKLHDEAMRPEMLIADKILAVHARAQMEVNSQNSEEVLRLKIAEEITARVDEEERLQADKRRMSSICE